VSPALRRPSPVTLPTIGSIKDFSEGKIAQAAAMNQVMIVKSPAIFKI
jgi:hypothetical protein